MRFGHAPDPHLVPSHRGSRWRRYVALGSRRYRKRNSNKGDEGPTGRGQRHRTDHDSIQNPEQSPFRPRPARQEAGRDPTCRLLRVVAHSVTDLGAGIPQIYGGTSLHRHKSSRGTGTGVFSRAWPAGFRGAKFDLYRAAATAPEACADDHSAIGTAQGDRKMSTLSSRDTRGRSPGFEPINRQPARVRRTRLGLVEHRAPQ